MNYAEMSDFEINQQVGNVSGLATVSEPVFKQVIRNSNGKEFDPCNSWADAGQIIQSNYLSIECDDMFDVPMPSSYWKAYNPKGNHYTDENPLRAAMIVFLMMQEEKCSN